MLVFGRRGRVQAMRRILGGSGGIRKLVDTEDICGYYVAYRGYKYTRNSP